jgi:hypothetical protein
MTNKSLKPDEERAKFEAWCESKGHRIEKDRRGGYVFAYTATVWVGWLARAQLEESCPTTCS